MDFIWLRSLLSLYLHRIVLLTWCDARMISIPAANNNLFILHGMDFIYWRFSLWLQPLTITTLPLSPSYRSINVVWWTNDIDTSCQRQLTHFACWCQQQLIYFAWHGLYLLTCQLVSATLDHHYSLSLLRIVLYRGVMHEWYRYQLSTCQQQLIYFSWHGLYLLTFQLVTATLDHHYSHSWSSLLSFSPSYRSINVVWCKNDIDTSW